MNRFVFYIVALTLVSCAKKDEDVFEKDFLDNTFVVTHYKELESTGSSFPVSGTKKILFTSSDTLTITYDSYREASLNSCTGVVEYNYLSKVKEDFDSELKDSSDQIDDGDSEIFSIFDLLDAVEEEESTEETAETLKYYTISYLVSNSLNGDCPVNQPDKLFMYLKLFKNGDLEIYNYNRQTYSLAK